MRTVPRRGFEVNNPSEGFRTIDQAPRSTGDKVFAFLDHVENTTANLTIVVDICYLTW